MRPTRSETNLDITEQPSHVVGLDGHRFWKSALTIIGHCRRRKIRCIPAFEDTSGRCANCIRLKKDCQFYPVDQQTAPVSRRARTTSKTDAATDESESTSEVHGPLILKSSPGTQLKSQMNGLISSPLSPQDISGFPAYAGRGIRSESFTEYSQRHGLNPQFTQRMSVHDPALHGNPDTSSSQQSYYPQLPSHVMPSPLQSSPHPGLYDTRSQTLSSTHSWSSATGSEETHGPYTAFRAYSHPSSFRRASEPQHVAFGYRDNAEMYGHESYNRPYHDPPTYTGAEYTNQIPTTSTDHYPPTWYSSQGLPNVREEDDHMHRYSRDQP